MAILRSVDGTFYEVPDDQLDDFQIPPEEVKEKLQGSGEGLPSGPPPGGPPPGGGGGGGMPPGGLVYVQVFSNTGGGGGPMAEPQTASAEGGEVQPYQFCSGWRNWKNCCWRNWRNWRNCC